LTYVADDPLLSETNMLASLPSSLITPLRSDAPPLLTLLLSEEFAFELRVIGDTYAI
jgi:hypothetical protein